MSPTREGPGLGSGRGTACGSGLAGPVVPTFFMNSGGGAPRPRPAIGPIFRGGCDGTSGPEAEAVLVPLVGAFSAPSAGAKPKLEVGLDGGGRLSFSSAVDRVVSVVPNFTGRSELGAAATGGGTVLARVFSEADDEVDADVEWLGLTAEPKFVAAKGKRACASLRLIFT